MHDLTHDQIPRLEPAFFHDVGRAREAHYKAIPYRILDVYFRPMCSCGAELEAPDERLVQKGPEWYYKCNACARNFTLDDAIRMTAQLRQMAVVSKMKDDTSKSNRKQRSGTAAIMSRLLTSTLYIC